MRRFDSHPDVRHRCVRHRQPLSERQRPVGRDHAPRRLGAGGVAVLGAIILRGRDRCWWLGFALFGGGYLALVFAPWESKAPRHLGTTDLLDYVHAKVVGSPIKNFDVTRYDKNSVLYQAIIPDRGSRITWPPDIAAATLPVNHWSSALPGAANYDQFQHGHAIFALITAHGGLIAIWFYERQERAGQPPGKLVPDILLSARLPFDSVVRGLG